MDMAKQGEWAMLRSYLGYLVGRQATHSSLNLLYTLKQTHDNSKFFKNWTASSMWTSSSFCLSCNFCPDIQSSGIARRWNNELGLKAEESCFSGIASKKMCKTNAKRSKLSQNRRNLAQITSVPRQFWMFCISFACFFIGEFFCEGFWPKSHQKGA